jgi:acetolactate synthase-1/2/3 large subunit
MQAPVTETLGETHRYSVADFVVESLVRLGVRHVFGVGGANIEDMFQAVQKRRPELRAVLCKHEHAAGSAADAYGRLRGLGVVMVTSGGGTMNLVHSIAEARASNVPVLAILGEPPTHLQGNGAFQDTSGRGEAVDALTVFRAVGRYVARVERASDVPGRFDEAVGAALGPAPGPAVLLIAKDLQRAELDGGNARLAPRTIEACLPRAGDVSSALEFLRDGPVVVIAGAEVTRERAERELFRLVELLDATVATTPDGRDAFDNRHPRFLGVAGAMGHGRVARALSGASCVLVVGTRLPILVRQGLEAALREKALVSVGRAPPFMTGARGSHLRGDMAPVLGALVLSLSATRGPNAEPRAVLAAGNSAVGENGRRLDCASVLAAIDRVTPRGSVVLVDAGNTGASAVHSLRAPEDGRWLLAMGMAGMGYTFGAATGAAFATGRRCVVLAGDGAFYMHGMEIHTAVEHALPITYVIFDNRAHGMCLVRERLLLGENAGYNAFRRSRIGAGLAAMFPGLMALDCATLGAFEDALSRSFALAGPAVLAAELAEVEVPPFSLFQERAPGLTSVPREVSDDR